MAKLTYNTSIKDTKSKSVFFQEKANLHHKLHKRHYYGNIIQALIIFGLSSYIVLTTYFK